MTILNNVHELIQITESQYIEGVKALGKHLLTGVRHVTSGSHRAEIEGLKNQMSEMTTKHAHALTKAKTIGNLKGTAGLGLGSAGTLAGVDQYGKYQAHQQELLDAANAEAKRAAHPISSKLMDNPKAAAALGVGGIAGTGAGLGYAASKLRKKQAMTESLGHALTAIGGLGLGTAAGATGMEYQKNIEIAQNHLKQNLTNYDTAVKSAGAGAAGALGALGLGMTAHAVYKNTTKDTDVVRKRAK
jgi:hypothetical protein